MLVSCAVSDLEMVGADYLDKVTGVVGLANFSKLGLMASTALAVASMNSNMLQSEHELCPSFVALNMLHLELCEQWFWTGFLKPSPEYQINYALLTVRCFYIQLPVSKVALQSYTKLQSHLIFSKVSFKELCLGLLYCQACMH